MRHIGIILCLGSALALSACDDQKDDEMEEALKDVNVIDESGLNDVMLSVADPDEAVAHFKRTLAQDPGRIDLQRGLALSLVRAKRPGEAARAWENVVKNDESTNEDQLNLADALIRDGQWDQAEKTLDGIPPTMETYRRYRLEAMVADSNKEWKKADSFYSTAADLTTDPSGVLNNWGYSKLSRGDYAAAEKLFAEALTYDSSMFTAKNNLVLALSLIHISEPTRHICLSRMPSSA